MNVSALPKVNATLVPGAVAHALSRPTVEDIFIIHLSHIELAYVLLNISQTRYPTPQVSAVLTVFNQRLVALLQ